VRDLRDFVARDLRDLVVRDLRDFVARDLRDLVVRDLRDFVVRDLRDLVGDFLADGIPCSDLYVFHAAAAAFISSGPVSPLFFAANDLTNIWYFISTELMII
jgi:hypothetical protein